ncbi:uncharacterized protein [Amphiura filiformis]|uniref:uncharacterized protein n=1 Tax=Amphiura filiformis TaxID=82378 RepID=UPI003B20D631
MSMDLQLVMSTEDARKALQELKKENDGMQTEIEKLKQVKLFYQKQKEHLLSRHSQLKTYIDDRQHNITQARQKTADEVTKRFDQLYPLVEDIYYKKLLLLELKEQLYLAQTQQEEKEILQVLQATDLRLAVDSKETRKDADNPIPAWYHYMTYFIKENTRISRQKGDKSSCLLGNAVFYNVKFKLDPILATEVLSFSTRHRGICVFICIQSNRMSSGQSPFLLTSDLPLPELHSKGQTYLESRRNPVDFVMEVIWKDIEDHLLPCM